MNDDASNDASNDNSDVIALNTQNDIPWTPEHESIIIEWADKAMCYRWLHAKANSMYDKLNAWYTIPVIIISTLTGTASFAQQRIPLNYQSLFIMVAGAFNILAGIISTIQQFLKITQLNEAHRVSTIAWDKFYRNIKLELAKHPNERMDPKHMLKLNKEESDRLIETSPNIPEEIIVQFKINFTHQLSFDKIIKPEICDIMIPTADYRNPWHNEENRTKATNDILQNKLTKQHRITKQLELNKKIINDFILMFINLNNREPMETELIENLKDKIDVDIIRQIMDETKMGYIKNEGFV